jgi:hypothetical protein
MNKSVLYLSGTYNPIDMQLAFAIWDHATTTSSQELASRVLICWLHNAQPINCAMLDDNL